MLHSIFHKSSSAVRTMIEGQEDDLTLIGILSDVYAEC